VIALHNGDTFHGTMPAVHTRGEVLLNPTRLLGLDGMTVHWEIDMLPKLENPVGRRVQQLSIAGSRLGDDETVAVRGENGRTWERV